MTQLLVVVLLVIGVGAVLLGCLPSATTGSQRGPVSPLARFGQPLMGALHAAHSGHVGDYIVWLSLGVAVLGGLFGTLLT